MPFQFDFHRHVKIWISTDPNTFLNLENQLRLVRMHNCNPHDSIHFVYCAQLLSTEAVAKMHAFCAKNTLTPVSYEDDIKPKLTTRLECELASCIDEEINHLNQGGNPACISDMMRWLSPVYSKGTYADFDVEVRTGSSEPVAVQEPLLLSLGSVRMFWDLESLTLNNDIIAVVDPKAAAEDVAQIQQQLIMAYRDPNFDYTQLHKQFICSIHKRLPEAFSTNYAQRVEQAKTIHTTLLNATKRQLNLISPYQIRHAFDLEQAQGLIAFCKDYLTGAYPQLNLSELSNDEIIHHTSEHIRKKYKAATGWWSWLTTSKQSYDQLVAKTKLDDHTLCEAFYSQMFTSIAKESVIQTTGPAAIMLALFNDKLLYTKSETDELMRFSLSFYNLDTIFISKNSFKFSTPAKTFVAMTSNDQIGSVCDLSWLRVGVLAQQARENKVVDATKTLQRFYRSQLQVKKDVIPTQLAVLKQAIAEHIKHIQVAHQSCFRFYQSHAHQENLSILNEMLGCMSDGHFNAEEFKTKVVLFKNTTDVNAYSYGASHTRKLIDKLEILVRQSTTYALTKEGKVEITPIDWALQHPPSRIKSDLHARWPLSPI